MVQLQDFFYVTLSEDESICVHGVLLYTSNVICTFKILLVFNQNSCFYQVKHYI